ncbi:MAG: GvpL/GvpF family gas vesicle protein, partial [Alphaproteobacteria bacterium]
MFYLYGIIDKPNTELALPQGFGDDTVEVVICGDEGAEVGAVVSEIPSEPARDRNSAHTHMNVLTTLMQHCMILPLQFGIVFLSRDELVETVNRLHASLWEDLRRLNGQVEVNVKVTDRSPLLVKPVCEIDGELGEGAVKSGSEEPSVRYVTSKGANIKIRAQQLRGNELLAETIQAPFAAMVTGKIWKAAPSPSGRPQITANFLLPREQFDAFQCGVKDLKETAPRLD